MILVTGAGGKTGKAIVSALATINAPVRALVHREEQVGDLTALGAREAVIGDLRSETSMRSAMAGVRSVYLIFPNMHPHELGLGKVAIAAAQQCGVERLVYHSVLHPQTEGMPHHWHKLRVEEKIFESGLNFTILQPAAYMQNILASWKSIVTQGVYTVPYPVHTRLSLLHLRDLAEVAAQVLTDDAHNSATYELVGTLGLSQIEVADTLARELGRPVMALQQPLADWEARAKHAGLHGYALHTLLNMFQYYEQFGLLGNPRVLTHLLGRQPTTLAQFVAEHK